MKRCPCSVERMGVISIVGGDVCMNMWATAYAYPCSVGHMGAVRVCWHERSRNGYLYLLLSWFVCRNTNYVKRVMKSLIIGTTSIYRESM